MPQRPFQLLRWFALVSALVIGALALAHAALMSHFLRQQLFQREAAVTRDFVQNLLQSDGSLAFLRQPEAAALRARFLDSVAHFRSLPDVLRANVYSRDYRVLWSTNPALIGRVLDDNEELRRALAGELVVEAGSLSESELDKDEHQGLPLHAQVFIETYIPVRDAKGQVVGVVELYKAPQALSEALRRAGWWVAGTALGGALLLFGSLYGVVRRADRQLRDQQARLLEAETLAATGQLAAAVAHNIRNPLASIRSSAELLLDAPPERVELGARDILRDADRISARITELLRLGTPMHSPIGLIDLRDWLEGFAQTQQAMLAQRGQRLLLELPAQAAPVQADPQLLEHALQSLLANASEAMPAQGCCRLSLAPSPQAGHWRITLRDNGSGIAPEALGAVQRPFVTTKPQGLGLGLVLTRRIVERLQGRLTLASEPGVGTTVCIDLPARSLL